MWNNLDINLKTYVKLRDIYFNIMDKQYFIHIIEVILIEGEGKFYYRKYNN